MPEKIKKKRKYFSPALKICGIILQTFYFSIEENSFSSNYSRLCIKQ